MACAPSRRSDAGVVGVYAPDVLHGRLTASTCNMFRWVAGGRRGKAMTIPREELPPPRICSSIKPYEKNRSEMSDESFDKFTPKGSKFTPKGGKC